MDMDTNELAEYFNSQDGAAVVAAAAAAFTMNNSGSSGLQQQQMMNGDLEAMVENARELRRQSIASAYGNGVGPDYLDMSAAGDPSAYNPMVSPTSIVSPDTFTMSPAVSQMGMTADMSSAMMEAGNGAGDSVTQPMTLYSPIHPVSTSMMMSSTSSLAMSPIVQTSMHQAMQMQNQAAFMQGMMPEYQNPSMDTVMKPTETRYDGIYSSSGFDMMEILYRVASRPNPQINIGAVDMSCSFVVTDARKFDNPIVYCSATFERLTGYSKHEILGRNCRFLQAPDGNVGAGIKRKYVDDDTVSYLKTQVDQKKEAQASLINYRKGGQPFMNLLTMIPITWDSDEVVYFVGFQVDLVEQPGSVINRNQDGSFAINYQYSQLPKYIPLPPPEQRRGSITVPRDDVSHVLSSIANGESELSKRIWDKVLLENTDDVVHVLSLKGLFLYCSPAIRKVLEYEPQELVGTALSTVCHPSDIVPVTRDLKEYSGSSINVVFRIRRKYSGYVWFESHGRLHTEQGKGRKSIILVGRERPVYMLSWKQLEFSNGIQDNEVWTKLSTSGMFLFVSSNIKALLDHDSEEMIGTSIQSLMRAESKSDIGKALETARSGKRCIVRHEIQNKRGQFLQCSTHLFPGDGNANQKPTFLVGQTRLLKHTRGAMTTPRIQIAPDSPNTLTPPKSLASSSSATLTAQPTSNGSLDDNHRSNSTGSTSSLGADGTYEDNVFDELKPTRSTSWQYELRQMQRENKKLVEELSTLLAAKKKRKRRRGVDQLEKDCANCHTRVTPEWRRGPSGKRDLCNSCGLRYAKLVGRVSPRTTTNASTSQGGDTSPSMSSPPTNGHTTLTSVAEDAPATLITTDMSADKSTPIMPTSASPNDLPPPRKKSITVDTVPMGKLNGTAPFARMPVTNGDSPNMDLSGG
ncbi:PAS domain-containing protein [Kalaharituber pfeilii]|nr:PAS domain-containing protein [Kalaharituber pfeilii]